MDESMPSKYEEAVATMSKMGIINGYADKTFRAKNPITRARKFVKIATSFYENVPLKMIQFSDVADNYWARQDIQKSCKYRFNTRFCRWHI